MPDLIFSLIFSRPLLFLPLSVFFQVSKFSGLRSSLFKSMLWSGKGPAVEQVLHTYLTATRHALIHSCTANAHTHADVKPCMLSHRISLSLSLLWLFLRSDIYVTSVFWWRLFLAIAALIPRSEDADSHTPVLSLSHPVLFLREKKVTEWRKKGQKKRVD